ncbi:DUF1015 domain-containing protein [Blastococcus goldschmidtiae]|uniref:DUF1015 domain-containing protein n=1 Tax=Blastococcus goldschmidtiae TaxID=3075546 RepID=A0ABU2KAD4_9ACTN|nr:DUF1015 domain-containing protein [Blastococcus sp. DSM 46792]MDT0277153.1 DUF1015 domain-containing protein [Blastococcus sp. DSM 46792]
MPSSPADRRPSDHATGLEVRPFRALTYASPDPAHLARVSSPAYDLVTTDGRERLAGSDPHNIVRLILPQGDAPGGAAPPAAAGAPPSWATQAAQTLRAWQDEGILVRDEAPAVWAYELQPPDGEAATAGWLAAVSIPAPGSSAVLPHEDTFPEAVEGRRALLAATRTDLEPIVLAHDVDPDVAALTDHALQAAPTLELLDDDGVRHRLWRVTEPPVITGLADALRRTGAVIADGHHRFAAARAHQRIDPGCTGCDAVLALVTPMGPGGLRVAAIHRVLPDLDLDDAAAAAARGFAVSGVPVPAGPSDEAALIDAVRTWSSRPKGSGYLISDGRRLLHLDDPAPSVRARVPSEAPDAWRRLDVVLAHRGLIEGLWGRPDRPDSVLIAHTVEEALRTATERAGVALLLRPPSPADVAAVARAGARMPRKSTLFVPKPRTGLVLRPLAD